MSGFDSPYPNFPERRALGERLEALFARPGDAVDPEPFNRLALDVFRFQYERCPSFARLCRARGIASPEAIADWRRVPCVPTDAFKIYRLACFPPLGSEVSFHTSGTTQGRPGVHVMPDTRLYDAAAMPWFARHLLGGMKAPARFLALTAPPDEMPHSSLVHMIETAGRQFGEGGRAKYYFKSGALMLKNLLNDLSAARAAGRPVLLLTTAFALVQCLESLDALGRRAPLPEGSRIMETGGYKGRSRVLSRDDLYRWTGETFGVPIGSIINEYGMTEMSSQFYDAPEADGGDEMRRIKMPPPWVRSRVLDPATLEPVAEGETGVLAHVDLANLDSCAFLLTADAARPAGGGFELLGRLEETEPRGCSLDYESHPIIAPTAATGVVH